MGQSIGLHVDAVYKAEAGNPKLIDHELRRRTWYSMFVLDRLLALQFGRPTAIHETDFAVMLPSRDEIPDFDISSEPKLSKWTREQTGVKKAQGPPLKKQRKLSLSVSLL